MPPRETPEDPQAVSTTHLLLIPSYNTGAALFETVRAARAAWAPVWVVIDGSTDGTGAAVQALAERDPELRVILLERNRGKGAAILAGLDRAAEAGFTHVLTMDADGQHPAGDIGRFMHASMLAPDAMILGQPVFGAEAPAVRVQGRRVSNFVADLETGGAGIGDTLFGFRVYPLAPLRRVMRSTSWMRRYDFDAEAAVRLCWAGIRPVRLAAAVRYLAPSEGGVSHFRYGRDNVLLTWMHLRLASTGLLLHLPVLLRLRSCCPSPGAPAAPSRG
ncbi:glycosyltransferase family 2 protein [Lichenicoccus roseus]|uniref:Glycosyltransferase family 2 protein n=2 Tax=Lichenicoccus roseus TaxID=2683649 RepID=A0A5R9JJV9_9PROT|nr:glycosyltransferase family 2 protein [Lichenicoccus roseus]